MSEPDPTGATDPGSLVVLGQDHVDYGRVDVFVHGDAAAAISVGSDPNSPSMQFKSDVENPNEDALCLIESDGWAGFAVADAHYGPESSHVIMNRLGHIWSKIRPTDLDHLAQMIEFLRHGEPPVTDSETTLLVVTYDRASRTGFGLSFGDSSFMIVGPDRPPVTVNDRDVRFVNTRDRGILRNGLPFVFEASPGELLLTFTDGVNECHYRQPATSVQPADIARVAADLAYEPKAVADGLAQLALEGVGGNPGGQDNLAVIVAPS